MILLINTSDNKEIKISLEKDGEILVVKNIEAQKMQAEKLLLAIEAILKSKKFSLKDIKGIKVNNYGESFTSLRIGVATANALGYALNIPVTGTVGEGKKGEGFDIIEPKYNREPV